LRKHLFSCLCADEQHRIIMPPADPITDVEKTGSITEASGGHDTTHERQPFASRIGGRWKSFERTLLKYNLEMRGIQRVEEHEKIHIGWFAYLQVFVLWVSINLAANNITLGMLGPAVYGLSFRDASLCACFGVLVGSIPVAWIATWGPLSGNRTMVSMAQMLNGGVLLISVRPLDAMPWAGGRRS
jgi:hypothetical protein